MTVMKILLLNNYDLRRITEQRQEEGNDAPAQHLWGYHLLQDHGIDADILTFEKHAWLKKIGDKLKLFGDLDQQWRVLRQAKNYDTIYSAQYLTTPLLAFMRKLGLLNTPIVAIGYQAPKQVSTLWKFYVRNFLGGNDHILCLSQALADDLVAFGVPAHKISVIGWGVDMKYYTPADHQTPQQPYMFSAGKTHRDYETLLSAFHGLNANLKICGAGSLKTDEPGLPFGHNIEVIETMIGWRDFIENFRHAAAVAIPLNIDNIRLKNAIGLTAVTEAMAVGKPIIMTRNDYIGIDVEKEGIGYIVESGDVEGWKSAVRNLMDDPEKIASMGQRARKLAEEKYNIDQYSNDLANALKKTSAISKS